MIVTLGLIFGIGAWASWQAGAGAAGFVRFGAMNAAVAWSAHRLVGCALPRADRASRVLWVSLFALAQIVLSCAAVGFAGELNCGWLISVNAAVALGLEAAWRRRHCQSEPELAADQRFDWLALGVAAMALFACAAYLRLGLALPVNHIDDFTQHLRFPVEWMKAGRVFVCFAPFGYDAPSYAPCNAELFYTWLLLPFRSDVLAKVGQYPFLLFGAVAVYRLALQVGAGRSGALCGASLWLLSPAALRQSVSGNVDVAFASLLVVSASCLIDYYRERGWAQLAAFAVAVGLMLGTKLFAGLFVACLCLAAAPAVLTRAVGWRLASARCIVGRIATAAALMNVFGGWWYVRNWALTGSALYPMAIKAFGITIMPGAYDRASMVAPPVAATEGLRPLVEALVVAFGVTPLVAWLGLTVLLLVAGLAGCRSRRSGAGLDAWQWVGLAAPLLYVAVLCASLPYYSPNHFLPAVALAGVVVAVGTARSRALRLGTEAAVLVLMALHMLPLDSWAARGRSGLVQPWAVGAFVACAAASFAAGAAVVRLASARWRWVSLPAMAIVSWLTVCYVSAPNPGSVRRKLVRFYARDYGEVVVGWLWVESSLHGETIAHTGDNMPYPLYGPRFVNDVVYVNIDEHQGWKFHDYELHERTLPGSQPPRIEKPGYYRRHPNYDAWLANLRRRGATFLFVARVDPLEASYNQLDGEGFPIERTWADEHPGVFEMAFENDAVKVYRIKPDAARPGGRSCDG